MKQDAYRFSISVRAWIAVTAELDEDNETEINS